MEIEFSFFSSAYLDVSVQRVPSDALWIHAPVLKVFLSGFPHSDISGSSDICSSPKLFAAYHVFHRLLVPRHPPCALISLTVCFPLYGYSPVYSVTPSGRVSGCCFRLTESLLPPHSICVSKVVSFRHGFRRNASDVLNISILDIVFNMWFSRYVDGSPPDSYFNPSEILLWMLPFRKLLPPDTCFTLYPVGLSGLEPPTSRLSGVRSNRLSYKPF